MKIAVIYIATGEYAPFWEDFYRSSEQYFCIDGLKSYELFTDSEELQQTTLPNVNIHRIKDKEWITTINFESLFICQQRERLEAISDYILFLNSNFLFTSPVYYREILPDACLGNTLYIRSKWEKDKQWLAVWPGKGVIDPSAWYYTTGTPDLLPPHWQTIPILPDNELLRDLSDELLLSSNFLESPGLFNGKMGSVLFFFHYARHTQNILYEEYAGELLERICSELAEETPINFSNGLCGIGWGIEYLVREGFLDCNTNEVLVDIDRKIMERNPKRMADIAFETGLEGIACYVQTRRMANTGNNYMPFDSIYLTELETACIQNQIPFESNNYPLHKIFEQILSWAARIFPDKLLKWQIGTHILKRQEYKEVVCAYRQQAVTLSNQAEITQDKLQSESLPLRKNKHLFIFTQESKAAKYGVGTYIKQLIECFDLTEWHVHKVELNSFAECFNVKDENKILSGTYAQRGGLSMERRKK